MATWLGSTSREAMTASSACELTRVIELHHDARLSLEVHVLFTHADRDDASAVGPRVMLILIAWPWIRVRVEAHPTLVVVQ
jgi:hypothetical protein